MSSATMREMLVASGQLQPDAAEEEVFQGILFGRNGRPQVGPMQTTYKSGHKKNEGSKKPAAKKTASAVKEKKNMSSTTRETATEKKNNEATEHVLSGLDEAATASRKLIDRLDTIEKNRRIDNERELVSSTGLVVGGVGGGLIAKYAFKMTVTEAVQVGMASGFASMAAASCLHTLTLGILNRPKKAKKQSDGN